MLQTIEGVYENGRVDLAELPHDVGRARVIVTFLPGASAVPGASMKAVPPEFTSAELAELRGKFAAWDEDWNSPGMEAYDSIDAARSENPFLRSSRTIPT